MGATAYDTIAYIILTVRDIAAEKVFVMLDGGGGDKVNAFQRSKPLNVT